MVNTSITISSLSLKVFIQLLLLNVFVGKIISNVLSFACTFKILNIVHIIISNDIFIFFILSLPIIYIVIESLFFYNNYCTNY